MKQKILTGLTATNKLTLGNYIGAIKPILEMQNKDNEIFLFVADLHAISQNVDKNELKANINNLFKLYLASGFNPKTTNLFVQSNIAEHSELAILLMGQTYLGELNRMTQFKDKSQKLGKEENGTQKISSGLLFYPILMAADILLYNPQSVIVGQDQNQHMELTRKIAERMNRNYGLNLNIPKTLSATSGSKIMSLKKPDQKMSKSDKNQDATIFMLDDPKTIRYKINKTVTDSEGKIYLDKENKPGIYNLLTIYSALKNVKINDVENNFKTKNYQQLKAEVAEAIIEALEPIQKTFYEFNDTSIEDYILQSNQKVKAIASKNLQQIKRKMGL